MEPASTQQFYTMREYSSDSCIVISDSDDQRITNKRIPFVTTALPKQQKRSLTAPIDIVDVDALSDDELMMNTQDLINKAATKTSLSKKRIKGLSSSEKEEPALKKIIKKKRKSVVVCSDEDLVPEIVKPKKLTSEEKDQIRLEKEALKEQARIDKAATKAALKAEKQLKKDTDKLALLQTRTVKSSNKLRTKLDCVTDMIVDIDTCFTLKNSTQLILTLQESEIETNITAQPIADTITWRKRMSREWDTVLETWTPCVMRILEERFVVLRVGGDVFCTGWECESVGKSLRDAYPGKIIIIIIEGLDQYLAMKSRETRNEFAMAVRNDGVGSVRSMTAPSKETLHTKLINMQIKEGFIIQHTDSINDTAEYISEFTREIGILTETERRDEFALKLKFADQIRSGVDNLDTFRKMLEQIFLVSESVSLGISRRFATLGGLYAEYEALDVNDGRDLLTNVQTLRGNNQNVKCVGKVVSRRIYDMLMCEDGDALMLT